MAQAVADPVGTTNLTLTESMVLLRAGINPLSQESGLTSFRTKGSPSSGGGSGGLADRDARLDAAYERKARQRLLSEGAAGAAGAASALPTALGNLRCVHGSLLSSRPAS